MGCSKHSRGTGLFFVMVRLEKVLTEKVTTEQRSGGSDRVIP